MDKDMYILGIETSCDETAASVVKNGHEIDFERRCVADSEPATVRWGRA